MSERRLEAYSVRKSNNSAFFHCLLNTIQKSTRHGFVVAIFNRKCIFSVNQGGTPSHILPRLLRYAMSSEIEQKPGRPGSSKEDLKRTYAITPTFNSTGNLSVGATAFSGMITVTPG